MSHRTEKTPDPITGETLWGVTKKGVQQVTHGSAWDSKFSLSRQNVSLPQSLKEFVENEAHRMGLAESEIIRRAVLLYRNSRSLQVHVEMEVRA